MGSHDDELSRLAFGHERVAGVFFDELPLDLEPGLGAERFGTAASSALAASRSAPS